MRTVPEGQKALTQGPSLYSGFRQRARTPAKRFNFGTEVPLHDAMAGVQVPFFMSEPPLLAKLSANC
jgi:hypothetical protein